MANPPKTVVIVGGSISGLMAGLTLSSAGCKITILERIQEASFKAQGAGLGVRPDVGDFLATYKPDSVHMDRFPGSDSTVLNKDGTVAGSAPWPPNMYSTSWTSLAKALRESLPNDIQFGCEVTNITRTEDKLSVEYQNSGTAQHVNHVDLVVGADGANSTVRRLMGATPPRTYAGYCLYRGIVSISDLPSDTAPFYQSNNNFWSVHDHNNILIYRVGADAIMWGIYRSHNEEELKDVLLDSDEVRHSTSLTQGMRSEVLASIKELSKAHFPRQLDDAVQASSTATVQVITDCESPANTFMEGKVVLIGEASVLPRPHVAAGTGHSAYHALKLRDLAEGTIDATEWSRNTKAFSDVLKDASYEQGKIWMEMDGNFEVVMASRKAMVGMLSRLEAVRQDLRVKSL